MLIWNFFSICAICCEKEDEGIEEENHIFSSLQSFTVLCSTTQWMCLCDARTISWIMETDSSMGVIWTIGKVIYLDTYNDCKAHSFGKIKIWMMSIWFHDFFCSNKHHQEFEFHRWLEIFGKILHTAIKVLMGDILIRSEIM